MIDLLPKCSTSAVWYLPPLLGTKPSLYKDGFVPRRLRAQLVVGYHLADLALLALDLHDDLAECILVLIALAAQRRSGHHLSVDVLRLLQDSDGGILRLT